MMFRGKTMVPCGALLLAGAAAHLLLHPVAPAPNRMDDGYLDRSFSKRTDGHRQILHGRTNQSTLQTALDRLDETRNEEMSAALKELGAAWPRQGLEDAVAHLFSSNPCDSSTDGLRSELLNRWAKESPAEAAAWAESVEGDPNRQAALTQVALAWCVSNPSSAWNWARALPNDPARQLVLASLAYEFSRDDPAFALDCSNLIEEGPERIRLIEHAIANLAATNPTAALERTNGMIDECVRNSALASLATSLADSDPRAAATLAVNEMASGPDQERTVIAIVQRWAQINPADVRTWVDEFPDGPLKANALDRINEMADQSQTTRTF